MVKSDLMWLKVVLCSWKWVYVVKSGFMWLKVVVCSWKLILYCRLRETQNIPGKITNESWGKVAKSGEKWRKVAKNWKSWKKWGQFFAKWHFGWPKITFDCISRHFRSIRNFYFLIFFSKCPPAAILEVPFLAISDQYTTFICFKFFLKRPICAKNNRVLPLCVINGYAKYEVDRRICDTVRDARGHFVFPIDDKNHRVLVIWDLNGYGEYEFDRCICDKVMACTSVGGRRRRRRRRRNQKHNITEFFKFRGYN